MEICKNISKTYASEQVNTNCCNCDTYSWGSTSVQLPPVILEQVELGLYDFNPAQYIIPIKIACHGLLSCLDSANCCGDIVYYTKQPHYIGVSGLNPANVSFFWATGQTFSRTTTFGCSYSNPLYGICMIVDKDAANVEIPKASTIQVQIQKCPNDTPFTQTIHTENFFNYNYSSPIPSLCTGVSGSATPDFLAAPVDMWGNTSCDYVKALCNEDRTIHFRYPVALNVNCVLNGGVGITHPLKTIKNIRIVSKFLTATPATPSTHPITVAYDPSVGLWFFNVDKDPGGLVHTATTMAVEVDYMTTDYCADLNNQVNNAVPFDGKLKMVTVGATAPFNPIYKNSFVTSSVATC